MACSFCPYIEIEGQDRGDPGVECMGLFEEVEMMIAQRAVYVKYHKNFARKSSRNKHSASQSDLSEEVSNYLYFDKEYSVWVVGPTLGESASSSSSSFNVNAGACNHLALRKQIIDCCI
jgi:hypothetical protein